LAAPPWESAIAALPSAIVETPPMTSELEPQSAAVLAVADDSLGSFGKPFPPQ
jgi:hypothetical protein